MMEVNGIKCWKFSECAEEEPSNNVNWEMIKQKYENGTGCAFGIDNLMYDGVYKLMGWCYDFRDKMKKYLVKQHGQWSEYWAPSKTLLRRAIYGRIDKIVELKD